MRTKANFVPATVILAGKPVVFFALRHLSDVLIDAHKSFLLLHCNLVAFLYARLLRIRSDTAPSPL